MIMDEEAELERIRLYMAAARHRTRRLDVLLDEQERILKMDPSLNLGGDWRRDWQRQRHAIGRIEMRVFAATFGLAALAAFLAGFWTARLH